MFYISMFSLLLLLILQLAVAGPLESLIIDQIVCNDQRHSDTIIIYNLLCKGCKWFCNPLSLLASLAGLLLVVFFQTFVCAVCLLFAAQSGRLLHGRHFTYKSKAGDVAITFVTDDVEGSLANRSNPFAMHGPWLHVSMRGFPIFHVFLLSTLMNISLTIESSLIKTTQANPPFLNM